MSKQKYQPCHGPRKRTKYSSLNDKSLKKNKQIIQTYVVGTPQSRASSVFQTINKRKPQTLKNKHSNRYYLINPKAKLLRKSQTEQSDYQDEYLQELKSLKSQIKDLQKDIQEKRLQQYEDEYLSQIRNIKTQIIQLKNLHQGNSNKKFQQDQFLNDIHGIKNQLRELKKEFKEKRSSSYFPPINIYPSVSLNPQNFSLSAKKNSLKKSPKIQRPVSINANHQDELQELRQEVDDLKRQMLLSKYTGYRNPLDTPSAKKMNDQPIQLSKSQKIQRRSFSKQRRNTIYSNNKKDQSVEETMWRKNLKKQALKKIKKVTNAILFVNRLQRFSQKIRLKRQNFFKESFKDGLLTQIKTIRDTFVKATLQFTSSLPINDPQSSVVIVSTDNQSQRITKAGLVRKCINKFLDAIKETQFLPNIMQALTETCYFVCRHGSAGVLSNYFTSEELDIMCISKKSLKVMAERNLEKSQIISFIWVKLIIFNILLRTQTIPELKLEKNAIWNANFCLFGSIIYELCRKIQAEMVERVPMNYVIGNWKHLNFLNSNNGSKFKVINPSKSMVINLKQHQKTFKTQQVPNELLQGTVSKKYLSDVYEFEEWQAQIKRITNYVQLIHRRMCKYHAKLKQELI